MSYLQAPQPSGVYPRLSRGRVSMTRRRAHGQVSGLGAVECGAAPELAAGEKSVCCPDLGWVIYDLSESPYGICERAAASTSGGSGRSSGSVPSAASSSDPWAAVAARRAALDERRAAMEEEAHQRTLQEIQLRMVLGQISSIQAQQAARAAAQQAADVARAKRAEADRKSAEAKKVMGYAAIALAAAKAFALF